MLDDHGYVVYSTGRESTYNVRILGVERTRAALNYKKTSGRVYGRVPFGYRRNGDRLEPVAKELGIVRRMHAWREEGASLREIARRLNVQGGDSKRGGAWSHKTVGYMLRNNLYEASGTA